MFLKRHKITKWSLLYQIVGTNSSVRIFAFLLVPNKVSSNFYHTLDVEKKVLKCQIRKWNVLCIIFRCHIVWVLKCPFLALDNWSGAKLSCYPMLVSLGLLKKLSVVGEQMEIYFWNVQKDPLMLLLRCSIKLSEKKLVPPPDDAPKYCSGWLLELLTELTRKRWKWLWIRQSARSNLHFSPKTPPPMTLQNIVRKDKYDNVSANVLRPQWFFDVLLI